MMIENTFFCYAKRVDQWQSTGVSFDMAAVEVQRERFIQQILDATAAPAPPSDREIFIFFEIEIEIGRDGEIDR